MELGEDLIVYNDRRQTQIHPQNLQEVSPDGDTLRTNKPNNITAILDLHKAQPLTASPNLIKTQTIKEKRPSFLSESNVVPPYPMDGSTETLIKNVTLKAQMRIYATQKVPPKELFSTPLLVKSQLRQDIYVSVSGPPMKRSVDT